MTVVRLAEEMGHMVVVGRKEVIEVIPACQTCINKVTYPCLPLLQFIST